jgi:anthranilate synthase component 1
MFKTNNFSLNTLQVSGELDDDLQSWDALRAALPVGTVSGAPKVKSCLMYSYLDIF